MAMDNHYRRMLIMTENEIQSWLDELSLLVGVIIHRESNCVEFTYIGLEGEVYFLTN